MVFVAVLLLPLVGVLLLVMDRIEDRVLGTDPARGRHAGHRRHLRLVPGGRRGDGADPDAHGGAAAGIRPAPVAAGGPSRERGPAEERRRAA
ncbi:hypothetical protein ABZ858_05735 [Streptomyces sp. NPDC047017]|uniref:hypothetical protein n=1 Tax=Streptomyces sp. NPDC047017 TaxID=3155024 RepID=UPI0033C49059